MPANLLDTVVFREVFGTGAKRRGVGQEQLRQSGLLKVVDPDTAISMIRNFSNNVPLTHFYSWTLPWTAAAMDTNASRVVRFEGDSRVR